MPNLNGCQPTYNNPCLNSETIISNGGQIIHELDGTVSVFINQNLEPYNNINTKKCCEYLGYTFDIENQKCLWSEQLGCDDCEYKITLTPNLNDGQLFTVNDNENCVLDINLDYLFKFDCNALTSGETISEEVNDINQELNNLNQELVNLQNQIPQLSGNCETMTQAYLDLCYTISITTNNEITGVTNDTICCLTDEGLLRWESILGSIKYNSWLSTDGCDTTIYTNNQAIQLHNEGNQIALENNTNNPYFTITTQQPCDKKTIHDQQIIACQDYNNLLDEIKNIEDKIIELNDLLLNIPAQTCDDPIKNFENFNVLLSLDYQDDNGNYISAFEEIIFNIGEGNLLNYIIESEGNTGIIISGDSGVLPGFSITNDCDYSATCKTIRDEFIKELYLQQYIGEYTEPTNTKENNELLSLMGGWYDSDWLNYNISINDPIVIDKIKNRKIRLSLKVLDCCMDFSVLVDKLKLTKNCDVIENTNISITKPFGFELEKVVDNKKSWVVNEEKEKRIYRLPWRNTEYNINNSKLAINTKEITLDIDQAKGIEGDVFNFITNNNCLLECPSGTTLIEHYINIGFEDILIDLLNSCTGCTNQKQFQDGDCFWFQDDEPFDFQDDQTFTNGTLNIYWDIYGYLNNENIYQNTFYSGTTNIDFPQISDYINELYNISNIIGSNININNDYAIFTNDYTCENKALLNKNLKIVLDLKIEIN